METIISNTYPKSDINELISDYTIDIITPGIPGISEYNPSLITYKSKCLTTSLSEQVNELTTNLSVLTTCLTEKVKTFTNVLQIYYQEKNALLSDKSDIFFDLECGLNNLPTESPYFTSNKIVKKSCNLSDLECGFNI